MPDKRTCLCWSELKPGDFFLDVGYRRHNYCIKLSDNMYFDLEEKRMHRKLMVSNEMPRYFLCQYGVFCNDVQ